MKPFALSVAVLLAMSVSLAACNDEAELDYIEKNIEVWHGLPLFPGTVIYGQGNSEYRDGENGPVIGYTTDVTYEVSAATKAEDVIAFYVDALGGEWVHCSTNGEMASVPGPGEPGAPTTSEVLAESFLKDGARVVVGTWGLNGPSVSAHRYELSIDHDAKDDPCVGFPIVG